MRVLYCAGGLSAQFSLYPWSVYTVSLCHCVLVLLSCQVHRGFYYAYHKSQLRPQVSAEVLRLLAAHPGYSVGVTGHSLGGALASLCGLDLTVCPRCAAWHAGEGGLQASLCVPEMSGQG